MSSGHVSLSNFAIVEGTGCTFWCNRRVLKVGCKAFWVGPQTSDASGRKIGDKKNKSNIMFANNKILKMYVYFGIRRKQRISL